MTLIGSRVKFISFKCPFDTAEFDTDRNGLRQKKMATEEFDTAPSDDVRESTSSSASTDLIQRERLYFSNFRTLGL